MHENPIGIPAFQTVDGSLAPMGRSIIDNPENASGRFVWRLAHNEIDQLMEAIDSRAGAAQSKHPGVSNIPGCHIGQSTLSFVFVLDAAVPAAGCGSGSGDSAMTSLNAGFFVGGKHKVPITQRLAIPNAMIQIEDFARFVFKIRVSGPYPTSITPGPNGILAQPSSDGGPADQGGDAAGDGLASNFIAGQSRKRQSEISRQLTGQRLYFHDDLRGKKRRGVRAEAVPAGRPGVVRRSVCATSTQSVVAVEVAHRSAYLTAPLRQGGRPWHA